MKYVFPGIRNVFDTDIDKVNVLIIENPKLQIEVLDDIYKQTLGEEGLTVVSDNNKSVEISKKVELLDRFIGFDPNHKQLLSRISREIVRTSMEDYYFETKELLSNIESFLFRAANRIDCELLFTKINLDTIVKNSGMEILDRNESLPDRILNYIRLVTDLVGKKLFITINLRGYLTKQEMALFCETLIAHNYHCIMIENHEHPKTELEKRYIVDDSLCEIC